MDIGRFVIKGYWLNDRMHGLRTTWNEDRELYERKYYFNRDGDPDDDTGTDITFNNLMALLYAKDRLRKRYKRKLRIRYLDSAVLTDLGNIVMLYY
jgi:hypothetical protein